MNLEETLKILSVIKANYHNHFKDFTVKDANALSNSWQEMFADTDYRVVSAAVSAYMMNDTSGHPPKPGMINKYIRMVTEPEPMTEQEAANLIMKALRNSLYNSEKEFAKLPAVLQTLVGSPQMLREWSIMDSDTVHSVVSSNIMRSFRVAEEKQRNLESLPSKLRNVLEEASNRLGIED